MRILSLLALASLAAMPAAAQGIFIPLAEPGAARLPPPLLATDSVRVWGTLRDGRASVFVEHVFRNETDAPLEGIFVFPLPADAVVNTVTAFRGTEVVAYGVWSGGAPARSRVDSVARVRPESGLDAYAGLEVMHVPVAAIGPKGSRRVQITYVQPLRREGDAFVFRFPLSVGADTAPAGDLSLGLEVRTQSGFADLRSPGHAVDVRRGTEAARCTPRERCGMKSVVSERVRIVRLLPGRDNRTRDFELLYTPAAPAEAVPAAVIP